MKKKNFLSVLLSFLKVGTIGFGGGAALIPVIEDELVENNGWMDKESFDVAVVVSGISPASLPVSLCAIWDSKYSLLSAYAYAFPGSFIYLLLLTGFSFIGASGIQYISYASVGIIAFILSLLYMFINKNYKRGVEAGIKTQYLLIAAAAFLLTGENAVKRLIAMLFSLDYATFPPSIFSINIITLLLITFFIIGFIGASQSKIKLAIALLLGGLYALSCGQMGILKEWSLPLTIVLVVSVIGSIVYDIVTTRDKTKRDKFTFDYKPLRNLLLFILVSIILISIVYAVSRDVGAWEYAAKIVLSALTSFGGGEVYISISDATFVQTGFINPDFYYSQIVGVSSAMPGPVLCAIVTGVGYAYGSALGGVGFGWMFGLLGLCLSVATTALGALSLYTFFSVFKDNRRLQMIIQYIMPVVCGMLISTAISLYNQASSVFIRTGTSPYISLGTVLLVFITILVLRTKYRINDIILLLSGGAGTLATLSIINYFI